MCWIFHLCQLGWERLLICQQDLHLKNRLVGRFSDAAGRVGVISEEADHEFAKHLSTLICVDFLWVLWVAPLVYIFCVMD